MRYPGGRIKKSSYRDRDITTIGLPESRGKQTKLPGGCPHLHTREVSRQTQFNVKPEKDRPGTQSVWETRTYCKDCGAWLGTIRPVDIYRTRD